MYTIYVVFKCLEGKREGFVEAVKREGILDAVRAEEGCLRYDYYYSDSDPSELLLIEAWESARHQQIHIEQPHMARLRAMKDDFVESTTLREFTVKSELSIEVQHF